MLLISSTYIVFYITLQFLISMCSVSSYKFLCQFLFSICFLEDSIFFELFFASKEPLIEKMKGSLRISVKTIIPNG